MEKTVNVLGTVYTIRSRTAEEEPALKEADGLTDTSTKQITIRGYTQEERDEPLALRDLDAYSRKVLRHEITHAFFYESGLSCNAADCERWPMNEEMVDWIAIQGPKLMEAWKEAEAV